MNTQPRDIKTLLEILLGFVQKPERGYYYRTGLCREINILRDHGFINSSEWGILNEFIKENRPIPGDKFYKKDYSNCGYYFRTGNMKIRIKWLEYLIKNLDKIKLP